ncbi:phage tail tape measure protein [Acetobacter persici]|uniref:phage tail tape measure protein n=1 Tax=Acetobacter persici TaxID=1076596 RepID=UPI001BACBBF6|nr:phage tail tape measure protein [Acetobacter persici]MBS1016917.1 phage tail tape measure protein [Acetobacter persici]
MADDLRAKFELDFAVGSSEPLAAVREILERIDQSLEKLRQATNPFAELTEPVARATQATTRLNEAVTRTTTATEAAAEGVTALGGALNEIGEGATQAATGLGRMGAEAETAAAQVSTAMERAQAAYRAAGFASNAGGEAGAGGPGYFARVGAAGRGFHDAVQSGMGSAFGAAAAGFGVLAPIHAAAEYDNDLAHIGIGLDLHGAANQQFMAAYGRRLDALARDTGQTSPELAAAAGFFNREGYSSTRLDAVLPQVARIATAYNAAPDAVAKTTFALQENLGIKDTDTSGALAAIALAGKSADLPFEKLAPLFPQVAAAAGQLGVTGRSGVNDLAAAMAVVRKSTGTEGEAATDTRAFIQAITSPHTAKRFAKFGVDLFGTEENARRSGLDPIEAVMQQVNRITHGGQDRKALGELFNNEQDRAFTQAILMHMDQYQQIKARVSAATPEVINKDFETGLQSTLIRLHAFEDALSQTERRIGTAFVPVLNVATMALHGLTIAFDWLDQHTHGLSTDLIAGVGSVLAITAALGALGAVLIPLRAGLVLIRSLLSFSSLASLPALLNPVTLTIVGVTAAVTAGYLAWRNWDRIKPMLSSLGSWISGWAKTIGGYIMAPLHALDQWIDHSSIGQAMDKWLAHPAVPAAVPAAPAGHEAAGGKFGLHVSHDPGLTVRRTSGKPGMVSITPDRGRMVAVP